MDYLTFDPKRLIISLDKINMATAVAIYEKYKDTVGGFKINHASFNDIPTGSRNIMADFKLIDIPETIGNVLEYLIDLRVTYVTIYTHNSQSAFEVCKHYSDRIKLLGVTYLTSWSHNESYWIHNKGIGSMFERSIELMERFNFYGAITSAQDLIYFKDSKLKTFCPGCRFKDDIAGDQVRISTPEDAIENGADYIIMGRPIISRYKQEIDYYNKQKG
jgi:orotidine-5'-phosphate decarboxylase